jgi:DNA-binding beta-propeller fold protein YncE
VSAVGFNPNGKWGISGGFDGTLAAWKVATGEEVWRVEKLGPVTALAVDPAGAFVLVAADRHVHLLDPATGTTIRTHGKFPTAAASLAVSPDGKWYAAGADDGSARVWRVGENKAEFTLNGHDGPVRGVAVKDGGRWVLTAGADRTVRLWDTARRDQKDVATFRKHASPVLAAAFRANGTRTVSADRDATVLPWEIDPFLAAVAVEPKTPDSPKGPPDTIPYAKP